MNHIRNHYLRFGWEGLWLFFKFLFSGKSKAIPCSLKELQHPVFLRPESSDIKSFYQIIFDQDYNILIPGKPRVIVDLGANIGLASVFYLNKFPDAMVIGVEPEESNYAMLKLNTGQYSNFYGYHNAIWNKAVWLTIKESALGNWAYTVSEETDRTQKSVKAITVEQILIDHSIDEIDLLKIDIEGSEVELFSSNYESWLPKTKIMIIELHDWMREGCAKQFFATLSKYNFKCSVHKENIICYMKRNE